MRRLPAIVLCSLAAGLAVPASAGAVIVINKGIAGVSLGMTYPQVRAKLGPPIRSSLKNNPFLGGSVRVVRFRLAEVTLPPVAHARVLAISTVSRTERTLGGIGVGSTRAMLLQKLPAARCKVEFLFRHCALGLARAGHVFTDFQLTKANVVALVVVARIPASLAHPR